MASPASQRTELEPGCRGVLEAMLAAGGPPQHEVPIEDVRRAHERETPLLCGPGEEVFRVVDETVEGPAGPIPVRRYLPGPDPAPRVAYLHGGGWAVGSIDSFDAPCRALANASGCEIASIGYRRAPEAPFPAPLDDCLAAAGGLEAVAVAGDSAGGNLAAVVARRLKELMAFQLLIYPVTDVACDTGSFREFGDGWGLSALGMRRYWSVYLGGADGRRPDCSPLRASVADLRGCPAAHVITAGCDVLRDEGEAYARRLADAGVPVTHERVPGVLHGFWRWTARTELARRTIASAGDALRAALSG